MNRWHDWIGRGEQREDRVDEALVSRWCATLDLPVESNDAAPQSIHWCLCASNALTRMLGVDGHPRIADNPDSYFPPVPLPRRMWASSKIQFLRPLRRGQNVVRLTKLTAITEKQGASGSLILVDVSHEILGPEGLAVHEIQTIVYREAAQEGARPAPPPPGQSTFDPSPWDAHRVLTPSETLLFRYSALTFNSHRIHFDLPYATRIEGYRGLVVHGPLIATLLLELAQRKFGDNALRHFAFRGVSPAICGEDLHLVLRENGAAIELGAFAGDGRQVMNASAGV